MTDDKKPGRLAVRLEAWRKRFPLLDHVMSMNEHYTALQGSVLAGGVTYYGFLSFFPILALAFAVVGYVSIAYPEAREWLITAIEDVFPGIVSESGEQGTISLTQIENSKVTVGIIGFVGILYGGLGWVSALRNALQAVFSVPRSKWRNFFVGKAIDLGTLVGLGSILVLSVGVAGAITGATDEILDFVGLGDSSGGRPLVLLIGGLLGLAASTLLYFLMYRILGNSALPARPLWQGALLGAVGFEILKFLVVNVIGSVGGSAFAPLAIAITLVVWINYFSRLVMYGAAWAYTSPLAKSAAASLAK